VPGWLRGSLGPSATANIPAGGLSQADGQTLSGLDGAQVTLELRTLDQMRTTRNVIAQTRTGSTDNVVVAGAHLDSVVEGPGINANGTGDAALLETALELGGSPRVANAVRFTFWGGWEFGEIGSQYYMSQLTDEQQLDIAMYLNFDTLGSRNGGYFVYDGSTGPYGSAAITTAFQTYLRREGVPTATVPLTYVYSDELNFVGAGIPSGGLYTGQEEYKSAAQVAMFGGTANEQMDPCFHVACDNLGNVDNTVLENNARAMAYVVGSYAVSTSGVNGVPAKAQRAAMRPAATPKANAVVARQSDVASS
jgi:Zn-dependent M28 family amino/carboxypeptidase